MSRIKRKIEEEAINLKIQNLEESLKLNLCNEFQPISQLMRSELRHQTQVQEIRDQISHSVNGSEPEGSNPHAVSGAGCTL